MKAQASLEFMTTYGWALLVVITAIGAIVYFGFLDVNTLQKDYCDTIPELPCTEYSLNQTQVKLQLRNGFERDITVNSIRVSNDDTGIFTVNCNAPQVIFISQNANFTCTFASPAFTQSSKSTVNILINYTRVGGTASHVAQGALLTTVR
ncbi:hypothetical protein C4573_02735 [Candidatus Woesearchaeota archaeon]|nr:MAG: hypothetical protein C4573_02735 [Candidatus Woesearchaeota archaeon]